MRTYHPVLAAVSCFLIAGLLGAPPEEPKTVPAAGSVPVVEAGKAAEPGGEAVADKHAEDHLRSRVDQFWKKKIATKYDECYNMLTRESRSEQTLVNYIQRINTRTTGYRIESVTPDPASPDHVKVLVIYKLQALGRKIDNAKQSQNWYFEDGDWFLEYFAKTPFDSKSPKKAAANPAESAQATPSGTSGKPESKGMDPEQMKRYQEMAERVRKMLPSTKPSLEEALTPEGRTKKPDAPPPSAEGQTTASGAPAASAPQGTGEVPVTPGGEKDAGAQAESGKAAKPGATPAKKDPAQSPGNDPKK